ncbi:MAG TPA: ATP-binding protein [Thermoleophilaceae bacterium]|jgi:anti-sigma regulatory factor (Ser/Thr protein kinase)
MSEEVKERFAAAPEVPGHARALVRRLGLDEDTRSTVELIVSELVTNAVVHGDGGRGAPLLVTLRRDGACVHGKVCSQGENFEWTSEEKDIYEPGGLGLHLVDTIARDWGIEQNGCSCVWFECPDCDA